MAAPRVLFSFLLSLFLTTVRSQLSIVNVTTIKSGEPFSVTCDADRASVPVNVSYITSVTILRNTSILAHQSIALHGYNGPSIHLQDENIPSGRNWSIIFHGERTIKNNRAMGITMVVHDSVCTDADLYICHVEYTDDKDPYKINYNEKVENVTADVKSQLSIVNVTTIKSGEPFSVTCDADHASVPANISYITSVAILRNTSTLEQQTIAEYRFNGSLVSLESENIPLGRNWTISFTGAGTNENNRAMKITMVVYDSTCADAGLYICHVEYTDDNGLDMTSEKVENVTADTGYKNPYFIWIPYRRESAEDPCFKLYKLNESVTLECKVDGPRNGVKLVWRVGRLSSMGDRTFTDSNSSIANHIEELAPTPVSGDTCDRYHYESSMYLTINEFDHDVMYQCVVRDSSGDSEVGNTTIIIGKAVSNNPVFSWVPKSSTAENPYHARYMLNETVTLTCRFDGPSNGVSLVWYIGRLQTYEECKGQRIFYQNRIATKSASSPVSSEIGNKTRYQSTLRMTINEIDHDDVIYSCYASERCLDTEVGNVTITLNKVGYSNPVISWVPNHACTANPSHDKFMLNETVTLTCRINGPRNGVKLVWRVGRLQPFSSMGERIVSDHNNANITEETSEPVSSYNCNRYHFKSTLRMTINEFDHDDVMYQCVARNISDTEVGNVTITLNKAGYNNPILSWVPNHKTTGNPNHVEYMLYENVTLTCKINGPSNRVKLVWRVGRLQHFSHKSDRTFSDYSIASDITESPPTPVSDGTCNQYQYQSTLRMIITLSDYDDIMYQCVVRSSIPGDTEVGNMTITLNKAGKFTARSDASFIKAWISQLFLGFLESVLLMYT